MYSKIPSTFSRMQASAKSISWNMLLMEKKRTPPPWGGSPSLHWSPRKTDEPPCLGDRRSSPSALKKLCKGILRRRCLPAMDLSQKQSKRNSGMSPQHPHLVYVSCNISVEEICVKPHVESIWCANTIKMHIQFHSVPDFTEGKLALMKACGPGALSQEDLSKIKSTKKGFLFLNKRNQSTHGGCTQICQSPAAAYSWPRLGLQPHCLSL